MKRVLLFLITWVITVSANDDYFNNRILFCLKKEQSALQISYRDGVPISNHIKLNEVLSDYDVRKIDKWLTISNKNLINGEIKLDNIYRIEFTKEKKYQELVEIISRFRKVDDVYDAQLEEIYHLTAQIKPHYPNDTRFNEQWAIKNIMADYAWGLWTNKSKTPGDSSVLIGIVDTGCDYEHPDLKRSIFRNLGEDINGDNKITIADENNIDDDKNGYIDDFRGWDFVGTKSNTKPDNDVKPISSGSDNILSHGTYCASIAAAATNNNIGIAGISYNARLLFTKHIQDDVLDNPGLVNTANGILYCAEMGADIINCSYSGSFYSPFTQAVINAVVSEYDCIIVCAAGNDDWDNDDNPQYPADYNNTLSVAAVTISDTKANYSNYGESVDISAPGGEGNVSDKAVLSSIHWDAGGYSSLHGTSIASPVVAGAFALLKAWFPAQKRNWLINQLLNNADDINDANPDYEGELGSGRVNIYNAIARNIFPCVVLDTSFYTIIEDDGNDELNPGESGKIQITLANLPLWLDAENTKIKLSSTSPYISFDDENANFDNLSAGNSNTNLNDELVFTISEDASLEPIEILVTISANHSSDYPYVVSDTIQVEPKLNQTGFPVLKGYNISFPVTCDSLFDNGDRHVIVLAENDSLYVFNEDGSQLSGFPVLIGSANAAPIIADMNIDGQKEIVIVNREGIVRVFGNDGTLMFEHRINQQVYGNAAVANMDADLDLEIIFGTATGNLHLINMDGSPGQGFPVLLDSPIHTGVAVGDITGDNIPEIIFGSYTDPELYAFTADGDTVPNFPVALESQIHTSPIILKINDTPCKYHIFAISVDNDLLKIDLDGTVTNLFSSSSPINTNLSFCNIENNETPEIVFGTDMGRLYVFTLEGDSLQNFPVLLDGKISVTPVFADFNNDDKPEIVVSTDAGNLYIINNDGSDHVNSPAAFTFGLTGSPCIDDLDSDGDLEIFVGGYDGLNILDMAGTKNNKLYWNTYLSNNHRTGYFVYEPLINSVEEQQILLVSSNLLQNYPNPFNPVTTIEYSLSTSSRVQLAVYNILGQHIRTLVQGYQTSGIHRKIWDSTDDVGKRVVSGVYFYKLTIENESGQLNSYIRKMLLVR